MHKFKAIGATLALLAGVLFTGQSAAASPIRADSAASVDKEVRIDLGTPPAGDPLKLGKQVTGNPHKGNTYAKTGVGSMEPPPALGDVKRKDPAGSFYKYAVGKQTLTTPSTGVASILTVSKPYINPTYDWHNLVELAVQSADEQQAVEIGAIRQQATYGDNNVHLFVYHWVNGVETCYDGCGYVDYSTNTTTYAGMSLESMLQTEKTFGIERTATAWWFSFDGQWIGSMPDTIWSGASPSVTTFKQVNVFQGFGEALAGTDTASCMDLGTGPAPAAPPAMASTGSAGPPIVPATGAKVSSVTYSGQPTSNVNLNVGSTDSHWNTAFAYNTPGPPFRSFRFGGLGYC